jgi:thioredoxin-related protein
MCLECKEVEKIFKEILPKYQDKILYKAIIVDSRKDMDNKLIKKYNVQLVPTVIMLNSNGKICQKIEGAASKDQYETYIQDCK